MSTSDKDCSAKTQLLGFVSGVIRGSSPPERKDVIWAFPLNSTTFDLRVWNGTQWVSILAASQGVYQSALDELTEMVADVGGIPEGTTAGQLNGQSFSQLFDQLLFPIIPAVYEQPSALLQGSNPKLFKVGDPEDITLNASFDQADAGAITGFDLFKELAVISNLDSFVDVGAVLNSPGIISYQGIYDYAQGPVLDDSSGEPDPAGQIPAGQVGSNVVDYEWIYPYFFGSDADGAAIDVNLGTELLQKITGNSLAVQFPSDGPSYYWLAVPASAPIYTRYENGTLQQGDIGVLPSDLWAAPILINVDSGNFTSVQYRLYVTNIVTQLPNQITFKTS